MRFSRVFRSSLFLVALGGAGLLFQSHRARASWPPQPSADFTDPSNWPNDPDYKSRWNYWSFLPKQQDGTAAYLSADQALGASGMSVDKAWAMTIGRPDVRIAILDSGIEWESSDTANKAWLNPGELTGAHKPQDKMGNACGGQGALAGYDCNGDGVFNVADYRDDPRISPPDPKGQVCYPEMDPTKPAGPVRITGDKNDNCILDPGDIIELFSDGVDDDNNGFKDDISGWDFYRNDNNPYDDTRYGHGTGEAHDSSAEGNNMMDTIGTCPKCTFVPLRVGNSFITDVNNFGLAVVYATDNGARVVQEALGTINNTAFSKAAIDYAYSRGVTIVASMADENSRHHNMPSASNHTMPVHSIRYDGQRYDSSVTFLAFDSCTNYGGHGALSVSGTSCASEATGRGSGITGLVYSMGLSLPQPINLTAEETMQTLKGTADDVNVPESQKVDPNTGLRPYYESKAGWDQRFNYGRMNAFRAVSMVQAGLVPPEVDITSPAWYAPIYADRVSGSVPIYGHVSAARASSYDYVVEWAPGVEPDDSQFHPLGAPMMNVPGNTVSGGAQVQLGSFDPRTLDTPITVDPDPTHAPDPDSPRRCNDDKTYCWGPNDRTVTLRIRATAHYGTGDVKGEARRTIAVTNQKNGLDEDLLPGFPIELGTSGEGSAKLADIDGDGVRDIVFGSSDGSVHVYSMKSGMPKDVAGFPFRTARVDGLDPTQSDPNVPSYLNTPAFAGKGGGGIDPDMAREAIMNAPAVADLDGDGKPEIVVTTWAGTIYVLDHTGKTLPGWPHRLGLVPSCPLDPAATKPAGDCSDLKHDFARGAYASPVVVDMNKDGKLDIVQAAFDGNLYVYNRDATLQDGWPVRLHTTRTDKYNRIMTTPVPVDLNKDGIFDLVSGSNEEVGGGGATGPVFAVDGRGMKAPGGPYLTNWPFIRTSVHLFPVVAEGVDASPAAADFDGDGVGDVVVQGNAAPPMVVKADPGVQSGFNDPPNQLPLRMDETTGQPTVGFAPTSQFGEYNHADVKQDTMFPLFSQPSVGDLDQDGVPDVIMSGGSLSLVGTLQGGGTPRQSQQLLTAWSGATGKMMPGLPIVLEDFQFLINHAVADIDGDDYPEIITGTGAYYLHAANACGQEPKAWPKFMGGWITSSPAVGDIDGDGMLEVVSATRDGFLYAWKTKGTDKGVISWESSHHDNQNTGNMATTLDQGVYKRASKVIDCTPKAAPAGEGYEAGGGCQASPSRGSGYGALTFAGLAALLAARSRRRQKNS